MAERSTRRRFLARAAGLAGALWLSRAVPTAAAQGPGGPSRPLILVHGFADRTSTWYRADNTLVTRLAQAGYRWEGAQLIPFAYPSPADRPDDEDSQGDVAAAGDLLATVIRATAPLSPSGQVDLLGFSMGGLVSRWAINRLRDDAPGPRPLVNTALLLAAPNDGADVLLWLGKLGTRGQESVADLARELASIDLGSIGAQQMLPGSPFLQQLNDPNLVDDRVRYVLMAGAAQMRLQLGPLRSTVGIGDGVMSSASATHLPGVATRAFLLPELLGEEGEAPWTALRRSAVFHPRLLFNDTASLFAATELVPGATALRDELAGRQTAGLIRPLGAA